MKIDSHQHFWKYDPIKDSWIDDDMSRIKNDFLPTDVQPLLAQNGIDGCVAVQADQSESETHFLLQLASQHNFIKGVVGWVDFRAENIEERLTYFSQFKSLKGFRHIIQSELEDDFLLGKDFCNGISLLIKFGYTYDILIHPRHLRYAVEFVKRFPDQKFVINHIAKPFIKDQLMEGWLQDITLFKNFRNVSCKIAGLVTEADWNLWQHQDFKSYISIVLDVFGIDRVMFGSDWPVCLLAASYGQVCEVLEKNTSFLNIEEKSNLWGDNCAEFYQLVDTRKV
ncbi:amidohydrolase family protein [Arcticibacter svalbardensis]|nr:amidohydrolase family protein [Arcticibacter svalbardensis]